MLASRVARRVVASWPLSLAFVAFGLARAYAYAHGVRFEDRAWKPLWHVIDIELLETRLFESLLMLHGQPPLWNAWLGMYRKLFGEGLRVALALTFFVLGLVLVQQTYALSRNAGLRAWQAGVIAAFIGAAPATVLYENLLFYSYPEALLLVVSGNAFIAAARKPSLARFFALASCVAALVLLTALFHPIWMALVLAFSFWASGGRVHARAFLTGVSAPVLLVLSIMAKNVIAFDSASLSSWRGMYLARATIDSLPKDLRRRWIDEGELSAFSGVGPFEELAKYDGVLRMPPATGIPLLDRPLKSDGSINFEHVAYLTISRELERDALTVIRRSPHTYLASVRTNWQTSFQPASSYKPLASNLARIHGYASTWDELFGYFGRRNKSPWSELVLVPLVFGLARLVLARRRRDPAAMLLGYAALNVLFVLGVGALMEHTENQRFRFDVDPFIAVLTASCLLSPYAFLRMRRAQKELRSSPESE